MTAYPAILDFEPPKLCGYTRESAVAEKFEAMVKLGLANSRMKDFYDVWLLSRKFDFDGPLIADAVTKTFERRGTEVNTQPLALTTTFADDESKAAQWRAFIRKSRLPGAPKDLAQVVEVLAPFLIPVATRIGDSQPFNCHWKACGPWLDC